MQQFTKAQIRKFLIVYFGLHKLDSFGIGKDGILNYFDRVGSIQSDPLNIVGMNCDIIMQSRFSHYKPNLLYELLYDDHLLSDGFDKEAAVFLSKDWKKFSHIRKQLSNMDLRVLKYRKNEKALDYLDEVLDYVKYHKHTCSKDIKLENGVKGRWGSSSLSNCALDHLWCNGKIGISKRKHSTKYYSAIEDIIPEMILQEEVMDEKHFIEWYFLRRLDALGVYWNRTGAGWQGFYMHEMKFINCTLNNLVISGKVIKIQIEEMKADFYLSKEAHQILLQTLGIELDDQIRLIAPLDNLIWDRKLVKALFDFDYVWEVYKPIEKRKFGYYVLPVLYKDKFVARIEPSRDKNRENTLEIKKIWYEKQNEICKNKLDELLEQEIQRYNRSFLR